MRITREDLLRARNLAASRGRELTPLQALCLLKKRRPDIEVVDEPGKWIETEVLLSWMCKNGNSGTG